MRSASSFKLFAFFTVFLIGNTPVSKVIFLSEKDSFIAIIAAACMALLSMTACFFPFLKYPYLTLSEYLSIKGGKIEKKAFSLVFLALSAVTLASVMDEFTKFLSVTSLNFTPDSFALLAITAVAIIASAFGIKSILPLGTVVFVIFSLFAAAMVFFSAPMIKVENCFPVFTKSVSDLLPSAVTVFFVLTSDIILLVAVTGREADGKRVYKCGAFAVIFWALFTVTLTVLARGIFGNGLEIFRYPIFSALGTVEFLSFLPKVSFIFQTLLFSVVLIKSAALVDFISKSAPDAFLAPRDKVAKKLYRVIPALIISLAASALVAVKSDFSLLDTAHAAISAVSIILLVAINIKSYRKR